MMLANHSLVADEITDAELPNRLKELGYPVAYVDSQEALARALVEPGVDMLCLSISIAGFDYETFFKRLSAEVQSQRVMMVGNSDRQEELAHYMDMGAHDYIELPIHPSLLKVRVESCLGTRRSASSDQLDVKSALELANDLKQVILPLGLELTKKHDYASLQALITVRAQELCNADGAMLYLRQEGKFVIRAFCVRSLNINYGAEADLTTYFQPIALNELETLAPNSRTLIAQVAATGETLHVADVYASSAHDFSPIHYFDKQHSYRTVSCLTLPLKDSDGSVMGVLQLINAQARRTGDVIPFKINDQLAAEAMATQAAIALNNYILLKKEQELIKFETDVQVGRSVQASFLPKSLPQPEGWDIAAQFHPAREVAGDFYDVIDLKRGVLGLVIADVCDKGVPAALYMALTRSLLRALAQQNYSLSWADALFSDNPRKRTGGVRMDLNVTPLKEGLKRTNDYLIENHSDLTMFATMFFGLLNTQNGELSYVNCGHNPPFVIDQNCNIINVLKPGGPAVGMMPNMPFKIEKIQLNPGDTLMTYTDGVPEARSPSGEFFTDKRLRTFLTARPITSVEALLKDLVVELRSHISSAVQFDDITMLTVRREGNSV